MKQILCPHCGKPISPDKLRSLAGAIIGSIKSPARAAASRANGKLGGRPRRNSPPIPPG